jgi:RNA polymerase sigma-70 factor (ECF subfamily)
MSSQEGAFGPNPIAVKAATLDEEGYVQYGGVIAVGLTTGDHAAADPAELERLALDAAAGHPESTTRLLNAICPLLVRYCRARLGRRGSRSFREADEIAQEVGRAVLAAMPGPPDVPFLRLVHEIASSAVEDLPAPEAAEIDPRSDLLDLVHALPALDREIVVLRVGSGLSTMDTATILGLSPGEVKVVQHQALARLRALI